MSEQSRSDYEILKSLVGILEENFPEAEIFQPRYVMLISINLFTLTMKKLINMKRSRRKTPWN